MNSIKIFNHKSLFINGKRKKVKIFKKFSQLFPRTFAALVIVIRDPFRIKKIVENISMLGGGFKG